MAYDRDEFNNYIENNFSQTSTSLPWDKLAGVAGLAAVPASLYLGHKRYASGLRGWDYAFNALQHTEGSLPMGIGATFRLSEFMSPLAGPNTFSLLPGEHPDLFKSRGFEEYISAVTGKSVSELRRLEAFKKGFTWQRGVGYLGDLSIEGGERLASNVGILSTGPRRTGTVLEWTSRVLGVNKPGFFNELKETGNYLRPAWMPTGADGSKAKFVAQHANAGFSWAMGRMNLLLTSPFDLEIMQDIAKKVPILSRLKLGVKPGTGIQTLGRLAGKAGVALATYHIVKHSDYLARENGPVAAAIISSTIGAGLGVALGLRSASPKALRYGLIGAGVGALLGIGPLKHGPITGLGEAYAGLRITQAKISETLGLSKGAQKTEDYFPGLTKPTTLVAAAGVGLLLGGTFDYVQRVRAVRAASGLAGPGSGAGATETAAKGVYELVEKAFVDGKSGRYADLTARINKQAGFSKLLSQLERRFVGSVRDGKFAAAGAGRFAAIGAGAYSVAATVGSFAAGDWLGGTLQGLATAGAALAYAKKGPALALGILALPFLRTKESPEQLQRIYSGEELVPIKSGRYWESGKTPYEGGRPYYRPHRVAMMRSGSHEAALYGSEAKAWETDPVLHPLRFLADPYERERLMWEQGYRFPVSKTPFEDFPILGPVLAATVGRIIKPPKFLGREQWREEELDLGPRGMRSTPADEPILRTGLQGTIGEQLYRLSEIAGLPGFALSSIKGRVTGTESFFEKDQWATPSLVAGTEPSYWSLEAGGAWLTSEGTRRYIPHRRNSLSYKNPLPSGLPSWMPGKDSQYFLDFSSAEIYSKIKEPWARLPGAGYSQLNPELKGVNPEDYSPFHRYKVLADVAPWSKEYGAYSRVISKQMAEGRLNPEQVLEVQSIRKRVQDTKKAMDFNNYRYDSDSIQKTRVKITGELEPGVYTTDAFGSAPVVMSGVNSSSLSLATVARERGDAASAADAMRIGDAKRTQVSDFLRQYIYPGAEVDLYVHKDPSLQMEMTEEGTPQVQAIISSAGRNLNRELLERGLAQEIQTDTTLDARMATDPGGRAFGALWERAVHGAETPMETFVPLAPVAKFMHQRSALEQYQRSEVYSKDVAMWQEPVRNFLAPGLATTAWWGGWRGLPTEVKEKYMVEEYFDRLEYMKWKRLESTARARGEGELATKYSKNLARTKVGADIFAPRGLEMALSTKEKAYFREFVESPTAAERREISQIVSPQLQQMLHAQWSRQSAEAAEARAMAGVSQEGDEQVINRFNTMRNSYQNRQSQAMSSMQDMPAPNPAWVGWDASAEMEDYKVKTIVEQGMNPQVFGLWRSNIEQAESRPWVDSLAQHTAGANSVASPANFRRRFAARMGIGGGSLGSGMMTSDNSSITFNDNGRDRLRRYMHDDSIMQF